MSLQLLNQYPQLLQTIRNSLSSGKIANLYLLSGNSDVGLLGVFLANIFLHQEISFDEKDEISQSLSENRCLDVMKIEKLSKADVIDLKKRLAYAPNGNFHIFIINNFEKASLSATNSLLKILEESKKAIFIITTRTLNSVLPTIISRAIVFNLDSQEEALYNEELTLLFDKFISYSYVEFLVYLRTATLEQRLVENFLSLLYERTDNFEIKEIICYIQEMILPNLNYLMKLDRLLMCFYNYHHEYQKYFKENK